MRAAGWGGLEAVSEITGLARSTIGRGVKSISTLAAAERPGSPQGWPASFVKKSGPNADR